MTKLPDSILLAAGRYYGHRTAAYKHIAAKALYDLCFTVLGNTQGIKTSEAGSEWNKDADIKAIDAVAIKAGLSFAASSGTFWFSKETKSGGRITFTVTEHDYFDGGKRAILSRKQLAKR